MLRPIFTRLDDDRDDMLTFDQLYDALLVVTTNSFTAREMLYLFNVLSLTNDQKVHARQYYAPTASPCLTTQHGNTPKYIPFDFINPRPHLKREFRFRGVNFKVLTCHWSVIALLLTSHCQMFVLIASLAERIKDADVSLRTTIAALDMTTLARQLEKSKSLFFLFAKDGIVGCHFGCCLLHQFDVPRLI